MSDIDKIIIQLEQQRAAIDNAISALRTVSGDSSRSSAGRFMVTKRLPRSPSLFRVEQIVGVGDGPIEFLAGVQSYGDERFDRKSGSHRPE